MGGCGAKKRRERERRRREQGVNVQAVTSPPNVQAHTGRGVRGFDWRETQRRVRRELDENIETKEDKGA